MPERIFLEWRARSGEDASDILANASNGFAFKVATAVKKATYLLFGYSYESNGHQVMVSAKCEDSGVDGGE